MVTAGDLRHFCEVWQPVDTVTAKGDTEMVYVQALDTLANEWCAIEPLTGREMLYARQVRGDLSHKITFRYRSDVTHRTQFRWYDGEVTRVYNLGPTVDRDTRNVLITVYANEIR